MINVFCGCKKSKNGKFNSGFFLKILVLLLKKERQGTDAIWSYDVAQMIFQKSKKMIWMVLYQSFHYHKTQNEVDDI